MSAGASPAADVTAAARPLPVWWEGRDQGPVTDPVAGESRADLVVVGAGLTGLWAAVHAVEEQPGRRVVLLEGQPFKRAGHLNRQGARVVRFVRLVWLPLFFSTVIYGTPLFGPASLHVFSPPVWIQIFFPSLAI